MKPRGPVEKTEKCITQAQTRFSPENTFGRAPLINSLTPGLYFFTNLTVKVDVWFDIYIISSTISEARSTM
jgi:hypothetical protein